MSNFCKNCGTQANPDAKFCGRCGVALLSTVHPLPSHEKQKISETQNTANYLKSPVLFSEKTIMAHATELLSGQTAAATAFSGEMTFNQVVSPTAGLSEFGFGPLKILTDGIKQFFKGFRETFRDKRKLITVIVLAVVWIILNILLQLGINPLPVRLLRFLTFADGGTSGGVFGIVGGTVGKGVFAYFLMGMILPLFSGRDPLMGMRSGVKILLSSFSVKGGGLPTFLMGAGAALFAFNFLAGKAVLPNSMVGVASFFITLRAIGSKSGLLRNFLTSFLMKAGKNRVISAAAQAQSAMVGIAAGFAVTLPLAAIPFSYPGYTYIGYILGMVLCVAGVVVTAAKKGKKEVRS